MSLRLWIKQDQVDAVERCGTERETEYAYVGVDPRGYERERSKYEELCRRWTQKGNDAMQAVNLKAGFRPGYVSITVEGPLP